MARKLFLVLLPACLVLGVAIGLMTPLGGGTTAGSVAFAPADDAWRAALPADPDAATAAYLARLAPEARARSDAYFTGGYWLQAWNLLLILAIAALLMLSGASLSMRDLAERWSRRKLLQTAGYVVQFLTALWVLSLPMTVYQGFFREHQYGFATQRFGAWMGEQLIGLAVSLVLGTLLLVPIYGVLRRFRQSWVLLATAVAAVFLTLGMMVSPVFIDPLFNTYKPMPEGPTKAAVLRIARANGVPVTNVMEFDASRQTTRVSANVSGLFGTAAVRLNDNLLNQGTLAEIKAVTAHEVGHYTLNHIPKMLVFMALIFAVGFAFIKVAFPWAAARWGNGVRDIGDTAGLPLLLALFSIYSFATTPLLVGIVRVQEVEADYFSLNASREPDGFAEGQLKLIEYRKADPGALEEILFCDHPSPRLRIRAAMQWKAEHSK